MSIVGKKGLGRTDKPGFDDISLVRSRICREHMYTYTLVLLKRKMFILDIHMALLYVTVY
ncbi:hypothetical protein M378DRAFT_163387 [Amanita muscaria Koide BX008]|uniref:Uncharacterized protein n=1 Tax=Amanita muscaria (strain Koide BX008) TaxID=946122 RepID=A0A0C2TC12_AMAMK|nr:hypothetical protein M378DRAFT_163387 [Amanita muscaria Koide BX008]